MSRLAEVSPEGLSGVRDDLAATRDGLTRRLGPLRWRAAGLGVDVSGFDQALGIADRLGTAVLPVVEVHLRRAEDLSALRYGGSFGAPIPVIDTDPWAFPDPPLASMSTTSFTQEPVFGGGTVLSWGPGSAQDQQADARETSESTSISGWFADRWDDASDAVADGVDWAGSTVADAWAKVTDAGAAVGDWWESTTADLGEWVDEHGTGVRDFIGRHVGTFRFAASACRVLGWVVVAAGAALTVALTVIGAMGRASIGAMFGFGVGAVPAGATGAMAGASFGLKILGAGFSLVSAGDFLDVAAVWSEGTIDGQDLVKRGTFELAMAVGSFVGAKLTGKALEKLVTHLPSSWRAKAGELVRSSSSGARHRADEARASGPSLRSRADTFAKKSLLARRAPADEAAQLAPLRAGTAAGKGWTRAADVNPDPL